jgi:hypothetical protein
MAITATQKIITLDYWKSADKLKVGDYVFDKDGKIVQVKLIQHYFSESCYEVELDDHITIQGDQHLGFLVENKKYRLRLNAYKGVKKQFKRPLKFTNIEFLLSISLKDKRGRSEYSIPTTKPIEFPHQTLGVPPFIFGYWFFNRAAKNRLIVYPDTKDYVYNKFKDHGYKITEFYKTKIGGNYFKIAPTIESQLAPNIPTKIPANYLMASVEERTELLSGIIHAKPKQYSEKTDFFRFSSQHYGTSTRVQGLVESIGNKTVLKFDKSINTYKLQFKSKTKLIGHQKPTIVKVHYGRRYIKSIKPIQSQMCVHIETTGKDNSLLVGEGYIQTC